MLGDQIKKLRQARGINQVQLAQELSVSKQCISNWENNNILPSVELLKKIATFFSCSTDYLLEMNEPTIFIETTALSLTQIVYLQQIANEFRKLNNQLVATED